MKSAVVGAVVGALTVGIIGWLLTGVDGPFSRRASLSFGVYNNPTVPEAIRSIDTDGTSFTILIRNVGSSPSGPVRVVLSKAPSAHVVAAGFLPPPGQETNDTDEAGRFSIALRPVQPQETAEVVLWGQTPDVLENVLSGDLPITRVSLSPARIGSDKPFSLTIYILASIFSGALGFFGGTAFSRGYREGVSESYVEIYNKAKEGVSK